MKYPAINGQQVKSIILLNDPKQSTVLFELESNGNSYDLSFQVDEEFLRKAEIKKEGEALKRVLELEQSQYAEFIRLLCEELVVTKKASKEDGVKLEDGLYEFETLDLQTDPTDEIGHSEEISEPLLVNNASIFPSEANFEEVSDSMVIYNDTIESFHYDGNRSREIDGIKSDVISSLPKESLVRLPDRTRAASSMSTRDKNNRATVHFGIPKDADFGGEFCDTHYLEIATIDDEKFDERFTIVRKIRMITRKGGEEVNGKHYSQGEVVVYEKPLIRIETSIEEATKAGYRSVRAYRLSLPEHMKYRRATQEELKSVKKLNDQFSFDLVIKRFSEQEITKEDEVMKTTFRGGIDELTPTDDLELEMDETLHRKPDGRKRSQSSASNFSQISQPGRPDISSIFSELEESKDVSLHASTVEMTGVASSIRSKINDGWTLAMIASEIGALGAVRNLLDDGELELEKLVTLINQSSGKVNYITYEEVDSAVRKNGTNLDVSSHKWGLTALMIAASKGHLAVVQRLLNAGADQYLKTKDGQTAQDLAQVQLNLKEGSDRDNYIKIIALLSVKDRFVDQKNGIDDGLSTIQEEDEEEIDYANLSTHEYGESLDLTTPFEEDSSVLQSGSLKVGDYEAFEKDLEGLLKEEGPEIVPEQQEESKSSVKTESKERAPYKVPEFSDKYIQDRVEDGWTPLLFAASIGAYGAVNYILTCQEMEVRDMSIGYLTEQINLRHESRGGMTEDEELNIHKNRRGKKCITESQTKLLMQNGNDINATTKEDKVSALMFAADGCHLRMVQKLASHGADKSLQSLHKSKYYTAQDLANEHLAHNESSQQLDPRAVERYQKIAQLLEVEKEKSVVTESKDSVSILPSSETSSNSSPLHVSNDLSGDLGTIQELQAKSSSQAAELYSNSFDTPGDSSRLENRSAITGELMGDDPFQFIEEGEELGSDFSNLGSNDSNLFDDLDKALDGSQGLSESPTSKTRRKRVKPDTAEKTVPEGFDHWMLVGDGPASSSSSDSRDPGEGTFSAMKKALKSKLNPQVYVPVPDSQEEEVVEVLEEEIPSQANKKSGGKLRFRGNSNQNSVRG